MHGTPPLDLMKTSSAALRLVVVFLAFVCVLTSRAQNFNWTLSSPGLVSVGVYNSSGKLVRTVVATEYLPAGTHYATWDGLDNLGMPASSSDSYTWKVALNGNTYTNGWQVGNSGFPKTTAGHMPIFIEAIALDSSGNIYTGSGWDEAHRDIIKWSGSTGYAILSAGQLNTEQVIEGVAVEPDGSIVYAVGVSQAGNPAANKSYIFKVNLNSNALTTDGFGKYSDLVNFTSPNGPIKVYDTGAQYPSNATDADKSTMSIPIRSLALRNNTIYAPDSLGNRVLMYDKNTGSLTGTISNVPVACSIAVHSNGNIFVGSGHNSVRVYNSTGSSLLHTITGFTEVRSIAISGNNVFIADQAAGQIKKYIVQSNGYTCNFDQTFGSLAGPGDRAFNKLAEIRAVAADASGNIVTSDRSGDGTRLQKINSGLNQQIWKQLSLEFACSGSFSSQNSNLFLTTAQHAYTIDRNNGNWDYLGNARTETIGQYFGNKPRGEGGPARCVRLYNTDFFYIPYEKGGVGVYRVIPSTDPANKGPTLKLVSAVSEGFPQPNGTSPDSYPNCLWNWNDSHGRPIIEADIDVDKATSGTWTWINKGMTVDNLGQLWLASAARGFAPAPSEHSAIWVLKPSNVSGNPAYSWEDPYTFRVLSAADGRTALGVDPSPNGAPGLLSWRLAARASDGMIYALGSSEKVGTPQEGWLHPGGNVLMGFQEQNPGTLQTFSAPTWKMILPRVAVGLSPIEGNPGGVFVGGYPVYGEIHHYAKDGLPIATFGPGPELSGSFGIEGGKDWPTGALDAFQCLNAERGPDGKLDVFVADNYNQRIIWYRVDDNHLSYPHNGSVSLPSGNSGEHWPLYVYNGIGTGKYVPNATVNIRADDPPAGKVFTGWTGDTGSVANVNAQSTTATTLSGSSLKLTGSSYGNSSYNNAFDGNTSNYADGTYCGLDLGSQKDVAKIRLHARAGYEASLNGGKIQGANQNPNDDGSYSTLLEFKYAPTPGWMEIHLPAPGKFRYLRFRSSGSSANVAEIEFYRPMTLTASYVWAPGADEVRYFAKAGNEDHLCNSVFEGANDMNGPWTVFHDIPANTPPPAGWSTKSVNMGGFRYLRWRKQVLYCQGVLPEIEFKRSGTTVVGPLFGTAAVNANDVYSKAMDGNTTTIFLWDNRPYPGAYAGVDAGQSQPQVATPGFSPGGGTYTGSQNVTINCSTSGATVRYTTNGSDPSQTNGTVGTSVTIPSSCTLKAIAYKSGMTNSNIASTSYTINTGGGDKIRYYPRSGWLSRMVGGVFEGTNGDPVTGSYTLIHTISATPPTDWTEVYISLGTYRYLRYRSPNDGWGNVAEVEFYRGGSKQTGTVYGSAGSYSGGSSDAFPAAMDGNTSSFFDSNQANGAYVGLDTGTGGAGGGGGSGTGLTGRYYNDTGNPSYPLTNPFTGTPVLTRTDATVDFNWGDFSPGSPVTNDNYSAKWTGQVKAPVSGVYTFTARGDDGVRLYINGNLIANGWTDHGSIDFTGQMTLSAGQLYNIELQYYEHTQGAECRLQWEYPGQTKQAIPQSQLYPENTGTGLTGRYYNDTGNPSYPLTNPFSGTPVLTRTDAMVDFNWGDFSPGSPVTNDNYSAKWTGQVKAPVSGVYTFTVRGDDGVRLYLNGNLIANGWTDHGATDFTGQMTLTAGQLYNIDFQFYEHGGGAECRLQWEYPGQTKQAIPQSQLYPDSTGTGLTGRYYNEAGNYPLTNPFTGTPALIRTDATVDFNWGDVSPGSPVTADNYSVKWTGQVKAPVSGVYTFTARGDDGVRLYINGTLIADGWSDHAPTDYTGQINLSAGQLYPIEFQYYERSAGAECRLQWEYSGQAKQAIPQSQLYPQ